MLVLADQNRAFGYAAAASLAVHALLLAIKVPLLGHPAAPLPEPPLVARLVEPAPAVMPEPKPAPPPPEPPRRELPRPKPAAKSIAKPAPRPAPPVAVPPPQPAPKEIVAEGVLQAEPALPPAPPVAAVAPSALPPAPDPAAALGRFRQQLVDLAVRYKRYPRLALDNGWTGDVLVRIDVAAGGELAGVTVRRSSGYEVLDEQALEMFRRAAREVPVPAALRGKPFSVELRAIYNLEDRPG